MNERRHDQPEVPQELWRTALDKIVEIKHRAETQAGAQFRDLHLEDWEHAAAAFLEKSKPLCDALYKKFWSDYIKAECACGRTIRSIKTAEKQDDYPQDPLYPLVNAAVLKREHGNNRSIVDQILEEYETEHPTRSA